MTHGDERRSLALVTGGTGSVGRAIVRRLVDEGWRVRAFARRPEAGPALPSAVERAAGDVQDLDAVRRAMEGADAVVHAVGILRGSPGQTLYGVHVRGTENVVHAARESGVTRFIHVSGVRADPSSDDPLSRTKGLAERAVTAASGLEWTVLRGSLVFGIEGGVLDRLAASLRSIPLVAVLPCGGRGLFQPLWVEDLASCVLACLRGAVPSRAVYELGGPETWSYRDLARFVLERQAMRRMLVVVPGALVWAGGALPRLVGRPPIVTRTEVRQLCMDNRTDPAVLPRVFGIEPARLSEKITPFFTPSPP